MSVELNSDKQLVKMIKEGIRKNNGYCPCKLQKIPENKCMCEEFRRQISDPNFEGYCHCMLYYKKPEAK